MMERMSLPKARAVAAVTADDLENIAVAMAARAVHRDVRVVLRVGDGEVANETRSLLPLGLVRDVHRIAAALLAAMAVGEEAEAWCASATTRTCAFRTAGSSARSSTRCRAPPDDRLDPSRDPATDA
jgi:K+ transport systems, NAD-binding component